MWVEHEWGDTKRQNGEPEINQIWGPYRHRGVEKNQKIPHSHIYAGASKTGVQSAERYASGCETTACRDVSGTAKCQIAQDGLRVNLRGEYFENRRQ